MSNNREGRQRQAAAERPRPYFPLRRLCAYCVSDGVPRRSILVALLVGTLLNAINQGDVLLDGGRADYVKLVLTYAVPYCVATYGAVAVRFATARDTSIDRE